MHGAKATTVVGCASDREVLEGLVQAVSIYEFLLGRFTGIANAMGSSLNARKIAFESATKGSKKAEEMGRSEWWTASDGRELEETPEKAKQGLLFLGIKSS